MTTKTKKRPRRKALARLSPTSSPGAPGRRPSDSTVKPARLEGRERWTVRVRSDLVGRVNRAALYGLPRVTVSEILEAALDAELVKRERGLPAGVPLVARGEIPRGRLPAARDSRS